jgi:O-6-methylguanine DNA methyltransferase
MGLQLYGLDYRWNDQCFTVLASDLGLCHVALPYQRQTTVTRFLGAVGHPVVEYNTKGLDSIRAQFDEYFSGIGRQFDVALDMLVGTPFQRRVWDTLRQVPYGSTWSYAELAARSGHPKAYRAVAAAVAANPIAIVIPCHRIIGSDGTLTGFGGGLILKQQLLTLEGVRSVIATGHEKFAF